MKKILFFMFFIIFIPFVNANLMDNLIAYYKLDETTGTTAKDYFNLNNGTANNARVFTSNTGASGIINSGADFTQGNDSISFNNAYISKPQITMSAWVYPTTSGGDQILLGLQKSTGNRYGFVLRIDGGNLVFFATDSSGTQNSNTFVSTYNINTWYHVVFTYENGNLKGYINGNNIYNNNQLSGNILQSSNNYFLEIGRDITNIRYWNGYADEVAIYNRSLSAQEVEYLYNEQKDGLPSGQPPFSNNFIINAKNSLSNQDILTFSADINNTIYTTTNGTIITPFLINESFLANITIFTSGYLNKTYTNYLTDTALTALLFPDNEISITFRDETTRSILTGVQFQIVGTTISLPFNDSNITVGALPPDTYEIRYSKTDYTTRSYFFKIPIDDEFTSNITLYLLNESIASNFVVTVTDTINQPIKDNLVVSLLRRYPINNLTTYEVVEMVRPAFALGGAAPFTAVANNIPYLFRVQDETGKVIFQGSGKTTSDLETLYLIDTDIFIKLQLTSSPFLVASNLNNVQTALSYNNISNTFFLSHQIDTANFEQICLNVYENNTNNLYSQSCTNSNIGVISVPVDNTTSVLYIANANVVILNNNNIVNWAEKDFRNNARTGRELFNGLGVFFLILTLIFVGVVYASQPSLAVILSALTIIGFSVSFLNLVTVPIVLQGSILIVSIIVAYVIRK